MQDPDGAAAFRQRRTRARTGAGPAMPDATTLLWADSAVGRWPGTMPFLRPAPIHHRRALPAPSSVRGRMPQLAPIPLEAAHGGHCRATTPAKSGQCAGKRAGVREPAVRAEPSRGCCGEGVPARPPARRWRATAWPAALGRQRRPMTPVRQSPAGKGAGRVPVASKLLRVSPGARHRRGWWLHPANARNGASALCSSAPSVRSVLLRRSEAMPAWTRDVHSATAAMTIRGTIAKPTSTAARDISRRPAAVAGLWRELS